MTNEMTNEMNEMTRGELAKKLSEVIAAILPGKTVESDKVEPNVGNRVWPNKVGPVQENIDYIRLAVKYLLLDLEATRRENAELRAMLGNCDGPDM